MKQRATFWASVLSGLGVLDALLDRRHDGSTFSEATRWAKDQVPYGDVVFTAVWAGFAYWFWRHILKPM